MRAALLLLFAGTFATSAVAGWQEDGKPVPDTEWRKSSADFGVLLEFTKKPDQVFAAWNKPGAYVYIPSAEDTARRNEVIVGLVFFTGCKPDSAGNCNASVDYLTLRPDGSVYADLEDGDLWKGKPAPTERGVQLAAAPLGIRVEPTDPLGKYTVRATVRDHNAGITLELVRQFEVVADDKTGSKP